MTKIKTPPTKIAQKLIDDLVEQGLVESYELLQTEVLENDHADIVECHPFDHDQKIAIFVFTTRLKETIHIIPHDGQVIGCKKQVWPAWRKACKACELSAPTSAAKPKDVKEGSPVRKPHKDAISCGEFYLLPGEIPPRRTSLKASKSIYAETLDKFLHSGKKGARILSKNGHQPKQIKAGLRYLIEAQGVKNVKIHLRGKGTEVWLEKVIGGRT